MINTNDISDEYAGAYLVYARRSTDDARNQQNTIEYQREACLRYVKENGLQVASMDIDGLCVAGVVEERHSGYKTEPVQITSDGKAVISIERPKFQRLVQLLNARAIRGIVCLSWDRLSRNEQDKVIIKDLLARGIDIRFVQAEYERSSVGSLRIDLDAMISENRSRVDSEKIRCTNAKIREQGRCLYRTPIGYLDYGTDNKPIDPERGPVVKELFETFATGQWTLPELTRLAAERGLRTKPRRRKRTPHEMLTLDAGELPSIMRPISRNGIESMLRNPFYVGKLRHLGLLIDGVHQPLVSADLFFRVQKELQQRGRAHEIVRAEFASYRGLLRCVCGRAWSPYKKKGNTYYLINCLGECSNQKRNLSERTLDGSVEGVLGRLSVSRLEAERLAKSANGARSEMHRRAESERVSRGRKRKKLQAELEYLKQNRLSLLQCGALRPEDVREETMRIERELEQLQRDRVGLADGREATEMSLTLFELMKLAKDSYKHALDIEKRRLTRSLFLELILKDGNVTKVRGKRPFDMLLKTGDILTGGPDGTRTRNFPD